MSSFKKTAGRFVRLKTLAGPEWTEGDVTITPVAKIMAVDGGAGFGGVVRAWPSAVLVSQDGRTSRLPIFDITRWAQVAILLAALLWIFSIWTWKRTRKER